VKTISEPTGRSWSCPCQSKLFRFTASEERVSHDRRQQVYQACVSRGC